MFFYLDYHAPPTKDSKKNKGKSSSHALGITMLPVIKERFDRMESMMERVESEVNRVEERLGFLEESWLAIYAS